MNSTVTILFFGDIIGKPGRKAIQALAPVLRRELQADVVIANLENLAHGKGLTRSTLNDVLEAGVDIGTGGNHTFSKPEAEELLSAEPNILVRPINYPGVTAGQGAKLFEVAGKKVFVINLQGQWGIAPEPVESPFVVLDRLLAQGLPNADATLVDFHAEATSEKVNMGWLADGRVGLVAGTHTHIPTADERILPGGTAYITDIGMVGLRDSSLGIAKAGALQHFLTGEKMSHQIPDHGIVAVNAILVRFDGGKARSIERIYREIEI